MDSAALWNLSTPAILLPLRVGHVDLIDVSCHELTAGHSGHRGRRLKFSVDEGVKDSGGKSQNVRTLTPDTS